MKTEYLNKTYQRKCKPTLTKVVIDYDKNIAKGYNDIDSIISMTVKQFEDMYEETLD